MEHLSDAAPRQNRRPPLSRRARRRREEHGRTLLALGACALIFLGVLLTDLTSKPHLATPIHDRVHGERRAP